MKKEPKYTFEEAKVAISNFCAYQERCSNEVYNKLQTWDIPYNQRDLLLNFLMDENYVDDNRFTSSYIRSKFKLKKWGKLKIKMHLKQKGIPNGLIEDHLKTIPSDEYYSNLLKIVEKKLTSLNKGEHLLKKKQKVLQHAIYKGYEMNLIMMAFDDISESNVEES